MMQDEWQSSDEYSIDMPVASADKASHSRKRAVETHTLMQRVYEKAKEGNQSAIVELDRVVKGLPYFSTFKQHFTFEMYRKILMKFTVEKYVGGQIIYSRGDPSKKMYILLSGKLAEADPDGSGKPFSYFNYSAESSSDEEHYPPAKLGSPNTLLIPQPVNEDQRIFKRNFRGVKLVSFHCPFKTIGHSNDHNETGTDGVNRRRHHLISISNECYCLAISIASIEAIMFNIDHPDIVKLYTKILQETVIYQVSAASIQEMAYFIRSHKHSYDSIVYDYNDDCDRLYIAVDCSCQLQARITATSDKYKASLKRQVKLQLHNYIDFAVFNLDKLDLLGDLEVFTKSNARYTRLVCKSQCGTILQISKQDFMAVLNEPSAVEYLKLQAKEKQAQLKTRVNYQQRKFQAQFDENKEKIKISETKVQKDAAFKIPQVQLSKGKEDKRAFEELFHETVESNIHLQNYSPKRQQDKHPIKKMLAQLNKPLSLDESRSSNNSSSSDFDLASDMFAETKNTDKPKVKYFSIQKPFLNEFHRRVKSIKAKAEQSSAKHNDKQPSEKKPVTHAASFFIKKKQDRDRDKFKDGLLDRLQGVLGDWESKFMCNLKPEENSNIAKQLAVVKSMCRDPYNENDLFEGHYNFRKPTFFDGGNQNMQFLKKLPEAKQKRLKLKTLLTTKSNHHQKYLVEYITNSMKQQSRSLPKVSIIPASPIDKLTQLDRVAVSPFARSTSQDVHGSVETKDIVQSKNEVHAYSGKSKMRLRKGLVSSQSKLRQRLSSTADRDSKSFQIDGKSETMTAGYQTSELFFPHRTLRITVPSKAGIFLHIPKLSTTN